MEEAQFKVTGPLCQKEPVEVAQAPDHDASRLPPFGGFPSMYNKRETLGKTQNSLKGLHISSGLGMPQNPPKRSDKF